MQRAQNVQTTEYGGSWNRNRDRARSNTNFFSCSTKKIEGIYCRSVLLFIIMFSNISCGHRQGWPNLQQVWVISGPKKVWMELNQYLLVCVFAHIGCTTNNPSRQERQESHRKSTRRWNWVWEKDSVIKRTLEENDDPFRTNGTEIHDDGGGLRQGEGGFAVLLWCEGRCLTNSNKIICFF